jgi:hypothetical protein
MEILFLPAADLRDPAYRQQVDALPHRTVIELQRPQREN